MQEDVEGFLYPIINEEKCNQCKMCEKICPAITQRNERRPLTYIYATKNPNEEIRRDSSSGGIFSLLAEHTINEGGVVVRCSVYRGVGSRARLYRNNGRVSSI